MPPIAVPAHEIGKIRIFSLSLSDDEARALSDDAMAQAEALGVMRVDASQIEVFPVSDLDSFGLIGYLREGNDVMPEQVERDRAKLAALEGWVMIVYSAAFPTRPQSLQPVSALTLIGSYDENRPETPTAPITAEAARPYSGTAGNTPATPPRGAPGRAMVILGLIVLSGLLLWWVLR
tara:strand:- start:109482 stop:110015 length:534 start_codon:yes stop_codon:yes gene_type:complete